MAPENTSGQSEQQKRLEELYTGARHALFDTLASSTTDEEVLRVYSVMRDIPRHAFVKAASDFFARWFYDDSIIPINRNSSLSQPSLVAQMVALLELSKTHRVLEVGGGVGYNAHVLSEMAGEVHTVEIQNDLAIRAREITQKRGVTNLTIHTGDGIKGLPQFSPYNGIIFTVGVYSFSDEIVGQLAEGGIAVGPINPHSPLLKGHIQLPNQFEDGEQILVQTRKIDGELVVTPQGAVQFHTSIHTIPPAI